MANLANWSPTDKSAALTVTSDAGYLGANCRADNTATAGFRTLRSANTLGTGKYIVQGYFFSGGVGTSLTMLGVGNGSADLSKRAGGDTNGYGVWDFGTSYNNAIIYSDGNHGSPDYTGTMQWLAIDMTSSPPRLWWRNISFRSINHWNDDTGWCNIAGTPGDPTVPSSGTDISGLGTPLYILGTADGTTAPTTVLLNEGGWTPLTEFVPIPSGYTMPDANYPYVIPAGSYTLSGSSGAGIVISQNNMRASRVGDSGGTSCLAWSSVFPASSKTVNAVFWDQVYGRNFFQAHAVLNNTHNINSSYFWYSDGTLRLGNTIQQAWIPYGSGQTTYMLVDTVNSRMWGTLDFSTYYGNGGASPDPATNTNGFDISGITGGVADASPGIFLNSDRYGAGTWNAGRIPDTSVLPPAPWRWLDAGGQLRSRIMMA